MKIQTARKIDSKNRVILPKAAMRIMGVLPGDRVTFDASSSRIVIERERDEGRKAA